MRLPIFFYEHAGTVPACSGRGSGATLCECCVEVCPYDSRPYREKFTLYWSREDFDHSENQGYLPQGDGSGVCLVRLDGRVAEYDSTDPACGLPEALRQTILAVRADYGYLVK